MREEYLEFTVYTFALLNYLLITSLLLLSSSTITQVNMWTGEEEMRRGDEEERRGSVYSVHVYMCISYFILDIIHKLLIVDR